MIDIQNARVIDVVPRIIAREPWAQAVSAACGWMFSQILNYADSTLGFAAIDAVGETVIDEMAVELDIPNYTQNLDLSKKRELVRNAMVYWTTAGTNAALRDMLTTIFGDAEIVEWFDYDADPHHFKITTTNPAITGDNVAAFAAAATKAKRLSAVLDTVELLLSCEMKTFAGFFMTDFTSHTMRMQR